MTIITFTTDVVYQEDQTNVDNDKQMLKIYPPKQCCSYVKNVTHLCDQGKNSTQNKLEPLQQKVSYIVIEYNDLVSKDTLLHSVYLFTCFYLLFIFNRFLLNRYFLIDTRPTKTLNLIQGTLNELFGTKQKQNVIYRWDT